MASSAKCLALPSPTSSLVVGPIKGPTRPTRKLGTYRGTGPQALSSKGAYLQLLASLGGAGIDRPKTY